MNGRKSASVLIAAAMICASDQTFAQGFAGLGSDAQGFAIPERGTALSFPTDHGAHPDYRIEWWYVTANLKDEDGKQYGAQWTLFRSALAPGDRAGFADPQIWIGHAAITTQDHQYVAERLGRGGVGQAGVAAAPFRAWLDDWRMEGSEPTGSDAFGNLSVSAGGPDFSYTLDLKADGPLVLQGDNGFSLKSANGQASYYYSQPFYKVAGTITTFGAPIKVTGKAWLDREWSSQPLASNQTGWDWFSLHLNSGDKLMAFRLRDDKDGFISANWISADGRTTPLSKDDVQLEPTRKATVDGRRMPVEWRIRVPGKSLDITTKPLNEQSWMATSTPYWEGPINFTGSTSGVGYLEMTGY
ncbi:lipocalin-like domain-containing protein [Rhizobium johnstonii]|uniref:Attachment protein n=1 Tax=Rhizobium johnstonii (strain DSM 114642 / LMG 32736 / 3841) TaxID=216596 RepID=Q1M8D5_RHIJ3|nr:MULTISPECIES: lipocalin-like domain-containing protein [Rhizobium]MBB4509861.1 putative secreted hydrolase [Rhizobium leguminosarum]MBY5344582.1 iron ABC transporter permease [Rhizobium leguminosarum]MBY5378170.1 iron ABC transporter permease [Rhizobium leguminosarum]MBY5419745.1 iron ABC transporter permease [Rhizobium leguminosarum]NEI02374.1 iron ABC transporter permease [Rhizobium leguminosarum]